MPGDSGIWGSLLAITVSCSASCRRIRSGAAADPLRLKPCGTSGPQKPKPACAGLECSPFGPPVSFLLLLDSSYSILLFSALGFCFVIRLKIGRHRASFKLVLIKNIYIILLTPYLGLHVKPIDRSIAVIGNTVGRSPIFRAPLILGSP